MRASAIVCFCLGIVCLGLVPVDARARTEPLTAEVMRQLVGGGCDQMCQNACQGVTGCSTCPGLPQGAPCGGGGGGTGTAWKCLYVDSTEYRFCSPPGGAVVTCTPDLICRCTGGTPSLCKSKINFMPQSGNAHPCSNGQCGGGGGGG